MSKIKVSELRALIDKNGIEILDYNDLKIEIKKYLPVAQKLELVLSVYNSCIDENNGLKVVNGNSKEIALVYFITKYYVNINLPKDIFEAYDILIESRLYNAVENIIYDEVIRIEDMLDEVIAYEDEKYYQKNKPIYVINEFLNELIEKIPTVDETEDFLKNVEKKIGDFDPDKVEFVKRFMELNSGGKNENKKQK